MQAIGYLRVSTEGQAEGFGLDVQRNMVEAYCADHGHELVAVHHDETSGANGLDKREGLAAALDQLAVGDGEMLVIPRLDRLARDLVVQEQLLAEVWRMGSDVESATAGEANLRDDPDDPSRKLIRQVLGAISEYERAMIALRLRRGRMAKAARGGFATGSPPFGWKAQDGELVEHPAEQGVIDIIVEQREAGDSYREISDWLNRHSIPPKRGPGFEWHASRVRAVYERRRRQQEKQGGQG